jgi:hypothetical protein
MKTYIAVLLFLSLQSEGIAQGWEHIGPDSANWQDVRRLTGRWIGSSRPDIAAVTPLGIALLYSQQGWNYALRNMEPNIFFPGVSYRMFEFSEREPDSAFVGLDIVHTESSPGIVKTGFPLSFLPGPWVQGLGFTCWVSPITLVTHAVRETLLVAGVCGVYRSSDRGRTWDTVLAEVPFSATRLLEPDGPRLYKSSGDFSITTISRSTDAGDSWDSLYSFSDGISYDVSRVNLVGQGNTVLISLKPWWTDTTSLRGIVRTTDGGVTWSHVYSTDRVAGMVKLGTTPMTVFGAAEQGIIYTTNAGESWEVFNNGLPTRQLNAILVTPYSDTLLVATSTHGVLKVWNYTTDVPTHNPVPVTFELYQNYPNPFNPSTSIRYFLPGASHVRVTIHDLLGRTVATLVNEHQHAGTHRLEYTVSQNASGVYILRVEAGDAMKMKKMILMK